MVQRDEVVLVMSPGMRPAPRGTGLQGSRGAAGCYSAGGSTASGILGGSAGVMTPSKVTEPEG
jgi:hypothetical protein